MKTILYPVPLASVLCAASLGLLSSPLLGQQTPSASAAPQTSTAATTSAGYTLDISNGQFHTEGKTVPATMGTLADVLRNLYPKANIVLAPGVQDIQIGDLKLRASTLGVALEGLRVASGDAFTWREQGFAPAIDQTTGQPMAIDQTTGLPIKTTALYTLTPAAPRQERGLAVFNMRGYFSQAGALGDKQEDKRYKLLQGANTIVSEAFRQLYGSRPQLDQPGFSYYDDASLSIVTGPPEALDVARKVLLALPGVTTTRTIETSPQNGIPVPSFVRPYGTSSKQPQPAPGFNANP